MQVQILSYSHSLSSSTVNNQHKDNMCAINPLHKKRILFDFYTSHPMSKEAFDKSLTEWCLREEQRLNAFGKIRVHVKETDQEAE